jgi:hypothetical protein
MRNDRFALYALILALLLLFTGCVPEDNGPSVSTPIPTPTPPAFLMPSVPANTEKSVAAYPSLTMEEQIVSQSIAHLIQTVTDASPGEKYYETVRAYITAYMASGGVTLPEGFTVSASEGVPLYVEGDTEGEDTPSAQFFITNFNAPEGNEHVLSTVLELESGYLSGSDFPRYIARAVLVANHPKSTEYFLNDTDGDGSLDYAFRFYTPGVPYEESESECYIVHLSEWRFTAESVTCEAWAEAKAEYERFALDYTMRENVKKGINLTALTPERYSALSKNGKSGMVELDGLCANTAELAVQYTYKDGTSEWQLTLNGSEGVLTGGFTADGITYYDTSIACVDLTGDGKEEFLFSIMPHESAGSGGELHVFTQNDGALLEIFTVCDGNPSQKQTQYASSYFSIPDKFTYSDGTIANGFSDMYSRAACISTAGVNLLRITADKGQESAHTYLWWNGENFEVIAQKAA